MALGGLKTDTGQRGLLLYNSEIGKHRIDNKVRLRDYLQSSYRKGITCRELGATLNVTPQIQTKIRFLEFVRCSEVMCEA